MDEHLHNQVDKLFRDSLQSHRDEPSKGIWIKIENHLDEDDKLFKKIISRRRLLIAAGLIFFLSVAQLFTLMNYNGVKNVSAKQNQKKTPYSESQGKRYKNSQIQSVSPYSSTEKNTIPKIDASNSPGSTNSIARISPVCESSFMYFSDSPAFAVNFIPSSDLFPLHMQVPDSKSYSTHTVNGQLPLDPSTPDNLIVKPEKHSIQNRLSITTYFSQEFAGYNLSDNDATAADGQEIENKERNVFSASMGAYLNYRIGKRWVVQSGISYSWSSSIIDSSKSFAVEDNSGNVQFKLNTISGYGYLQTTSPVQPVVGDSVLTAKAFSELHYLTIPLILSYKIPLNRFSLLVGVGTSINFLTGATVETNIYGPNFRENESVIAMKGLKNINFGFLIKADLEYHINSTWGINLIPCFKNSLSPINIHSALSAYPYNFGIGAGISFRF